MIERAEMEQQPQLHLNDRIKLPDGRIGTICYSWLDGFGGVWGEHTFTMPEGGFGDELPMPQFILRDKGYSWLLDIECVGESYELIEVGP